MTPLPQNNMSRFRRTRKCPICSKPSDRTLFPFCSSRCRQVDLNRWLNGAYAIPGPAAEEDDNGLPHRSEDSEDKER